MNNGLKKYVLLLVVVFLSVDVQAQCAMCRAALESSDSGIKPEAVNDGIVYLMAFPYILVGLVGFAVYKLRKKKVAKAE
ncbi:hypothetical protein [Flavobacterium beibuense]|uniref:Membrane protein n=1 Tax=Flavobacterium beibuense F44-8 TaxID=1406840 RepID=A0A0A2LKR2_9FLAO|nr:hypothetical protein [Flavobacterium beibuense]KGO80504.1 membrane protein [Flavobacterium beibuense F44-8]